MASVGQSPALPFPAQPGAGALSVVALRRALALLSFAGLLLSSFVIVSSAATSPSVLVPSRYGGFPFWLRGALSGLGWLLDRSQFATWVMVMLGCYLVAVVCAPALRARWAIATIVVLHAIFLLGPPLFSADVFGYLDWARMGALHGLNPYVHDSGTVVTDPVYQFIRWHTFSSPYGPLFTLGTYALTPLRLSFELWAVKLAVFGASLGTVALIWRTAQALGRPPLFAIVLYGLNPAVLLWAVGGAHNDVLMMVVLFAGIHLAVIGRERAGVVAGACAVAIKASAGLVMPFMLLGARDRGRALRVGAGAGVAVLLVAFAAFGTHAFGFLNVLGTQQKLNSGSSVPAELGVWLGWSGSPSGVRIVFSTLGVLAIGYCLLRTWRGADWITAAGFATLALMVTSSWLLTWYAVWLLPLAALSKTRWLAAGAVGMTLFLVLVRTVYLL
ncbi:MAG TPA: hypothetical protein VIM22_12175 [Solirubrobacteraceae bacterium]